MVQQSTAVRSHLQERESFALISSEAFGAPVPEKREFAIETVSKFETEGNLSCGTIVWRRKVR